MNITQRPRRMRQTPGVRRLVAETRLHPADLVLPMFVVEGLSEPREISSMPGVYQHSLESLIMAAKEAEDARRTEPAIYIPDLKPAPPAPQGFVSSRCPLLLFVPGC